MKFITNHEAQSTFSGAFHDNLIGPWDEVVQFHSLKVLRNRLKLVQTAFPLSARHCLAIKSMPLSRVLSHAVSAGFGLEAASYAEVVHAKNLNASLTLWDSPAKTRVEFDALGAMQGLICSHDSLYEAREFSSFAAAATALLRINPEVESTAHPSLSVGHAYSKFGEPISNRAAIVDFVRHNPHIQGLHVHISSQTIHHAELVTAVEKVVDLALEIDTRRSTPLRYINIGGGFPVSYSAQDTHQMLTYAEALLHRCPALANEHYTIITEFGRYYHANAGFTAARVAQVKPAAQGQCLVTHAGADLFLRECYQPGQWPHRTALLSNELALRTDASIFTDVAGPLCFGGDYPLRGITMPPAAAGDWLIVHDTGANSLALWSTHCSRSAPMCVAYDGDKRTVVRTRDDVHKVLEFWG